MLRPNIQPIKCAYLKRASTTNRIQNALVLRSNPKMKTIAQKFTQQSNQSGKGQQNTPKTLKPLHMQLYNFLDNSAARLRSLLTFIPNYIGFGHAEPPWNEVPKILDPPVPYTFQNREKEIELFASTCLRNLLIAEHIPPTMQSDIKIQLLTAAQMWGSGKSWLGNYFLHEFKKPKYDPVRRRLDDTLLFRKHRVSSSLMDKFVYVQVNAKRFRGYDWETDLKQAVMFALLNKYPKEETFWKHQSLYRYTLSEILNHFKKIRGEYFFVHLDEFDCFLSICQPVITNAFCEDAIKRYYEIWSKLNQTSAECGATFYCSGRSPVLYALGHGYFHQKGLHSPGIAHCVLLDTLKVVHIKFYLFAQLGEKQPDEVIEKLAKLIYKRTAGVPRFVTYATSFLKELHDDWSQDLYNDKLLGADFIQYVKSQAPKELSPHTEMSKKQLQTYIELIRIAALEIPIKLDETTTASLADFGITDAIELQGQGTFAPFLELCTLYNLYVECVDSTSQLWKLVFPEIVLETLDIEDPRLPFWKSFLKIASWIGDAGSLLESITQRCFILRLGEALEDKDYTLAELFPFLKTSLCANTNIVRLASTVPAPFPKLVFSKKKSKPIDLLNEEDKANRLDQIKSFFENPESIININVLDWKYLHPHMKPGVLYIPGGHNGKSASADVMYLSEDHQTRARLDTQCKGGKQIITEQMLAEEGWKSALSKANGELLTLLVAGFQISPSVMNHSQKTIVTQDSTELAIHFTAGAKFNFSSTMKTTLDEVNSSSKLEFVIPNGMDIVVLLRPGMDQFLTKQNADVLADEKTITDFKAHLSVEMGKKTLNLSNTSATSNITADNSQ